MESHKSYHKCILRGFNQKNFINIVTPQPYCPHFEKLFSQTLSLLLDMCPTDAVIFGKWGMNEEDKNSFCAIIALAQAGADLLQKIIGEIQPIKGCCTLNMKKLLIFLQAKCLIAEI